MHYASVPIKWLNDGIILLFYIHYFAKEIFLGVFSLMRLFFVHWILFCIDLDKGNRMAAKDCQSSTLSESATAGRVRLTLCQTKESAQDSLSWVTKTNLVVNNASSKFSSKLSLFIVKTSKSVCLLWPTQETFTKKTYIFKSPLQARLMWP